MSKALMLLDKADLAKNILESWPDGLLGLDHYGKIAFCNKKATSILGWEEKDLVDSEAHEILCSKAVDYAHTSEECPVMRWFKSQPDTLDQHFEAWWVGANGVYVNLDVRILDVDISDLDVAKIISFSECTPDNVSQYEARRLAMFAELSPVPIVEIGSPMNIEFANPAMTELMVEYGFNDQGIPNILPPAIESLIAEAASTGTTSWSEEVEFSDRSMVWMFNIREKNKKPFAQVYGMDVSELRKTQRELENAKDIAERANDAKSSFLANMSHEIRTPMNAIVGFTDILLRTQLNEKQISYCQKIKISSNVLLEVVNDILDFSKIEAGKLQLENIQFNLIETIEVLADLFGDRANAAGVELLFDIDPTLPSLVLGDPLRLKQILINLVSNALKFTSDGYVEVRLRLVWGEHGRCRVRIEVKDTGKGIPDDKQLHLFAPFTQEDESTTRRFGGTGLGLSICRSLVELMDGHIGVRSKLGQGSIFYFEINLGVGDHVSLLKRQMEHLTFLPQRNRVVLLQGNEVVRRNLRRQCSVYGLQTEEFEDGLALVDESEWVAQIDTILAFVCDDSDEAVEWLCRLANKVSKSQQNWPLVMGISRFARSYTWPDNFSWPDRLRLVAEKPIKPSILVRSLLTHADEQSSVVDEYEYQVDRKPHKTLKNFSILVVDDNVFNRELALELLKDSGADLETADDGRNAVDKVASKSFDFILMDVQMPVMDGYEATRIIKERDPHQVVIALTANAIKGDRERFLKAGFDDYLSKPVEVHKLYDTLSFWAEKIEKIVSPTDQTDIVELSQSDYSSKACQPEALEPEEATAAVTVDADHLPNTFKGLQVAKALKMVGGKQSLYMKLMVLFIDNYRSAADNLLKNLQGEDLLSAGRLVHTVKGSASNLGAENLRVVAYELEVAMNDESPQLQNSIAEFCSQLDKTIAVMDEFLQAYKHLA